MLDSRPLAIFKTLLSAPHEVVVSRHHAGGDENVVFDGHVGGDVSARLDLGVVADGRLVLKILDAAQRSLRNDGQLVRI